jgi:hypothetical protein
LIVIESEAASAVVSLKECPALAWGLIARGGAQDYLHICEQDERLCKSSLAERTAFSERQITSCAPLNIG